MKQVIALRHVAFEGLDGFEPVFRRHGYTVDYFDMCDGIHTVEDMRSADILVVLGGPISANDEARHPFLTSELKAIEQRLKENRPLMGICLGSQLIARAAGARVYASGAREIGFGNVTLTAAGEKSPLAPFAGDPVTLHWHGETFDLPDGAILLASSDQCENQAFSMGDAVIGFQFHPEATGRNIDHWLVGHCAELDAAGIDPRPIREHAARYGDALTAKAGRVAELWLGKLAARTDGTC